MLDGDSIVSRWWSATHHQEELFSWQRGCSLHRKPSVKLSNCQLTIGSPNQIGRVGLQIFKPSVSCHSLQVTLLLEFCHMLSVQAPKSFYSINVADDIVVSWAAHRDWLSANWLSPKSYRTSNIDCFFQPSLVNRYARLQESSPVSTMSAKQCFSLFGFDPLKDAHLRLQP